MITPRLVTLTQLRDHLRLSTILEGSPPEPVDELDLQLKLEAATQLVVDYLLADKNPPDPAWVLEIESWDLDASPQSTAPAVVLLAVLEQAAEMYRFRGDDGPNDDRPRERDEIYLAVRNLLTKYHRPSFA